MHDEFVASEPDALSTEVSLALDAAGQPAVATAVCWCGTPEDGEEVLAPRRAIGVTT
jgi:hypothetical protein